MVKITTQTNIAYTTSILFESGNGIDVKVHLTEGELRHLKEQIDETFDMFDRVRCE